MSKFIVVVVLWCLQVNFSLVYTQVNGCFVYRLEYANEAGLICADDVDFQPKYVNHKPGATIKVWFNGKRPYYNDEYNKLYISFEDSIQVISDLPMEENEFELVFAVGLGAPFSKIIQVENPYVFTFSLKDVVGPCSDSVKAKDNIHIQNFRLWLIATCDVANALSRTTNSRVGDPFAAITFSYPKRFPICLKNE
ncbi:MAG: hypothetical protein KF690_05210 [Bacteroidetes bacterium]|nr:hypothetical protein [Bacteroidota bacterium]